MWIDGLQEGQHKTHSFRGDRQRSTDSKEMGSASTPHEAESPTVPWLPWHTAHSQDLQVQKVSKRSIVKHQLKVLGILWNYTFSFEHENHGFDIFMCCLIYTFTGCDCLSRMNRKPPESHWHPAVSPCFFSAVPGHHLWVARLALCFWVLLTPEAQKVSETDTWRFILREKHDFGSVQFRLAWFLES